MRQTAATGTVYAKTGTLTGVRALSGYLENPHQEPMLFSIIVNNQRVSGQSLVKAIDTIVSAGKNRPVSRLLTPQFCPMQEV